MEHKVAVVIPCFKVKTFILDVIASIPQEIEKIFVVDDACPENTGAYVEKHCQDTRVSVLYNPVNLGVGGATIRGYKQAIEDDFHVVVKIDGDGQMDCKLIDYFISPILQSQADYTKGNRFYNPDALLKMPKIRLLGNTVLSFFTKLSSGYWNIFDPTNGFTAISTDVLRLLPLDKISMRYFFESDLLFRLNTFRAVVVDIPIVANYGDERSNLKIRANIWPFLIGNGRNFLKRIFYNYYLRDFSLASINLIIGILLIIFGVFYGLVYWVTDAVHQQFTNAGTVMISALPIILGFQSVLSFLNYDISNVPIRPITRFRKSKRLQSIVYHQS